MDLQHLWSTIFHRTNFISFQMKKIHMLRLTVWVFKKKKKPVSQTTLEIGEITGEELLG